MTRVLIAVAGLALVTGGCVMRDRGVESAGGRSMAGHFSAKAVLRTAAGGEAGWATAKQDGGALKVTVEVSGMTPGLHGVHVHTTGKCDAPDFASAGGHWNPSAHKHGLENPAGPHAGDLPNVNVGADGKGKLTFTLPGTYEGLLDEDGAAMVVHAGADDLKTDPSGNSGGRVACGVFEAV